MTLKTTWFLMILWSLDLFVSILFMSGSWDIHLFKRISFYDALCRFFLLVPVTSTFRHQVEGVCYAIYINICTYLYCFAFQSTIVPGELQGLSFGNVGGGSCFNWLCKECYYDFSMGNYISTGIISLEGNRPVCPRNSLKYWENLYTTQRLTLLLLPIPK